MAESQGRTAWKIRFLTPLVDCNLKSLRIVSFFCQCCRKKNITRNDRQPFLLVTRPLIYSAVFLSAGLKRCHKGKAVLWLLGVQGTTRNRGTVLYQKMVVSYLVLMPLLASCPGSTIHGRFARVFCSEGSICFKTNANIQTGYHLWAQHR